MKEESESESESEIHLFEPHIIVLYCIGRGLVQRVAKQVRWSLAQTAYLQDTDGYPLYINSVFDRYSFKKYILCRESRYISYHDGMGVRSTALFHPKFLVRYTFT